MLPGRVPKFAHRERNAASWNSRVRFSDRACVSRTHAWQGDFLIQTKTVACSECITGYSGERDVAWQLIHVRVIHFREPFALVRTAWTLCCTIPPRVHLRSLAPSSSSTMHCTNDRCNRECPTDDRARRRDDLILNQSTAVSRSIYNRPWYESLVTRRPTVRFNENILIDRDATGLPNAVAQLAENVTKTSRNR